MFMTLNHRLFLATGDSKYIDVMERGMYNNALSGVSASGDRFFYVNRLASAGDGRDQRWQRASLECCPPNLVRFLASMPGYIYAQGPAGAIFVNLYVSSETTFTVAGQPLALAVESEMPWGGASTITVRAGDGVQERDQAADSRLGAQRGRCPAVCIRTATSPRDTRVSPSTAAACLRRRTSSATVTSIASGRTATSSTSSFPMAPRRVVADARVKDTRGKVAIERGPIVYCAEWPDGDRRPGARRCSSIRRAH